MLPISSSVAIGAADEDIAQKLHLDFFETSAAASFALTLRGIETERAGVESALFCGFGLSEHLADIIKSADIDGRVRARCFAEDGLVHQDNTAEVFASLESADWILAGGQAVVCIIT